MAPPKRIYLTFADAHVTSLSALLAFSKINDRLSPRQWYGTLCHTGRGHEVDDGFALIQAFNSSERCVGSRIVFGSTEVNSSQVWMMASDVEKLWAQDSEMAWLYREAVNQLTL